jgi:Tol biopolymer transport system component
MKTKFDLSSNIAMSAAILLAVSFLSCGGNAGNEDSAAQGLIAGESAETKDSVYAHDADSLRYAGEVHLRNVCQLTFGGNNAEAYWSFDDRELIFQSDWDAINEQGCDQQFLMRADGSAYPDGVRYRMVSTGKGRTTCGYFLADGRIIYASTHAADPDCPPPVHFSGGRYVWPVYAGYDIYIAAHDGSNPQVLIGGEGYDAEPTMSPDGRYIVFTSTRSGDLELWRYTMATGELLQLTDTLGYDGGAYFSRDSRKLVWRASRPAGEGADAYRTLLGQGLVEPTALNVFTADADGKNVTQVTDLPGANWAPFFHPSGDRVLFCSNHHTLGRGGRIFDIFLIGTDGAGLEQITHSGTFDAFPMFSYDGKRLVFASNRNASRTPTRDTNIFVADWVETPEEVDRTFGAGN